MPPVITFIGWHNSGKTTFARQVVAHLKDKGYTVAVIKSTKEQGIEVDQPETDTGLYKQAGADGVALLAPDQLVVQRKPTGLDLLPLAQLLFPEVDIVIAEGFKHAMDVPKIEVRRDQEAPLLLDRVAGVIALATDLPLTDGQCFGLDQSREVADFIETQLLTCQDKETMTNDLVNASRKQDRTGVAPGRNCPNPAHEEK